MADQIAAAPETQTDVFDPSGGANQVRVRAYNERLVLSLVRRHGSLAKAEIARRSGLSAQTVTVIMRALEADGLLIRGEPMRGKVGQPSVPMSLNPDAVYSLGLKIGRRSADLILMDFVGGIRRQVHRTFPYPMPGPLLSFVEEGMAEIEASITPEERARICGLGVATPLEFWKRAAEVGAPQGELDQWRGVDLKAEIARRIPYPVVLRNDAKSACAAELVFGLGTQYPDFLYVFIGFFVGGGVVLNSTLHTGPNGRAGSIGPLLVQNREGETVPLLRIASIYRLENLLREHGIDPKPLWYSADDWVDFGRPLDIWIEDTASALAQVIVASATIMDFSAVVIDGSFPEWVRARVLAETAAAVARLDLHGMSLPDVLEGTIGSGARSIGGASLPLFWRYLLDQSVLFKELD